MAVISPADYLTIANDYAYAREQVLGSVDFLFDAVYQVVMLNTIIPEVDLLSEFYNGYLVNANQYNTPVTFLSAVRALNNHVLNRTTLAADNVTPDTPTDIVDYITNWVAPTGLTPKIRLEWANLCVSAGFATLAEFSGLIVNP